MKKFISFFVIIITIISSNVLIAQINEQSAKSVADKFFAACERSDYRTAAGMLGYHGSDESRLYKDTYNFSIHEDTDDVKRFCNRVKATIEISDSYEFGRFSSRIVHGKEVKSLDVTFKSGNQKIKNKLIFIIVNESPVIFKLE